MTVLAFVVFLLSFLVALVGVVLPVLPGAPIALVGAVLAALMLGFERFGVLPLVYIGVLVVLSQLVDVAGTWLGSRQFGAGRAGVWGGVIGSLVGLFLFPPFGFLVGALAGAVVAELLAGRKSKDALRSGVGAFVGTLGGTVAKLVIMVVIGFVAFPRFFGG
ncbi:MAG TPA: DUF456 domain-containing protein [Trueperaceae bacterium]|nr:DUF456 domain-containing protein [Trueperaceae bacterium]